LRHQSESFFACLKPWRGIGTRYDTTAPNLPGAIPLDCAIACAAIH